MACLIILTTETRRQIKGFINAQVLPTPRLFPVVCKRFIILMYKPSLMQSWSSSNSADFQPVSEGNFETSYYEKSLFLYV